MGAIWAVLKASDLTGLRLPASAGLFVGEVALGYH